MAKDSNVSQTGGGIPRSGGGIGGSAGRFVKKIYKPTGPTKSQMNDARHEIRIEQEKVSDAQLKEHYRGMFKQWND